MQSNDLHCIVYVSSASASFTRDELEELLIVSRANNAVDDITGCLLHVGGNFMQVLEGPIAAVRAAFARISRNPRHSQIITILDAPASAREFPNWSMAFDHPTAAHFFRVRKAFESEAAPPSRAFALLKQFWQNQR